MKKKLMPLAVILAAVFAATASGCSFLQRQEPTPSSFTAAPSPSEQPSAEPSANDTATPSPEISLEPSPSDPQDGEVSDPTVDPNDYFALGAAVMQMDGIGPIRLNMTEDDLVNALGQPDSKTEPQMWGADGLDHSDWTYAGSGLVLNMAKSPDDTASIIFSITAGAPCELATQRGIKLGDTKDTVLTAYAEAIDPAANPDTDVSILIGSIYGGMIISIEEGLVTGIFIGAAAE